MVCAANAATRGDERRKTLFCAALLIGDGVDNDSSERQCRSWKAVSVFNCSKLLVEKEPKGPATQKANFRGEL
jgi:hypothetical protein